MAGVERSEPPESPSSGGSTLVPHVSTPGTQLEFGTTEFGQSQAIHTQKTRPWATSLSLFKAIRRFNSFCLIIQGDKDTTIPVKHAHSMQEKAAAVRGPVGIMIIKNTGHNWRPVDAPIDRSGMPLSRGPSISFSGTVGLPVLVGIWQPRSRDTPTSATLPSGAADLGVPHRRRLRSLQNFRGVSDPSRLALARLGGKMLFGWGW